MLRHVAEEGGDERIPFFIDSHVARCCISRGRSSAGSLRRGLQKAAALCLAYGLYPAGKYSPTRMNPADCPTRNVEIPPPVALISSHFSSSQLTALATISGLKRWAANWCRLALLLVPAILDFRTFVDSVRVSPPFPMVSCEWHMDFDATLGYPGEGPCSAAFLLGCMCWIGLPLSVVAVGVSRSHGDAARKAARSGIVLEEGRRTTELTAVTRDLLYGNFLSWLEDRGVAFDDVLFCSPPDFDQLNRLLCDFGRWLFREGKPYYHFSETINAITCKRPLVRRSLQQSWDLAFMWGSHEPAEHHIAMPYQILIALIAGAWSWGWKREAACFALAWGALLRIGEILAAKREDLVLPSDIGNSVDFVLLRIKEPKTRYRAARHQAGKLEQADLIEVVRIGFADLKPFEMLWNFSGSTLRLRLQKLLEKLDLPSKNHERPKALSLASFRPGGATHLMSVCESAELVRRRGRWASFRVMEIYLQEVAANTYLNVVVPSARAKVFAGLDAFPMLFQQVSLGNELLNESEVSASIVDLGDVSSPGYFDIQVDWVELEMLPVTYSGSLLNFTNFTYPATESTTAPTEDPDGTTTTVVSGLVLSMAVIPAAWVRLIVAERNGDVGGSQEELRKGRPVRKKLKSRPSQGPAAVDAG
eukprot:symbB.v1.2.036938.t1/scaffold5335.1/size28330/1